MSINDLKEKYPLSVEILWDFLPFSNNITENKSRDTILSTVLTTNGRILYDFFDDNQIYVNHMSNSGGWMYNIKSGEDSNISEEIFKTRKESEVAGFTKAFEILENKLNHE